MDLREIDVAHLRTNIGVVPQENFLFSGTIRENIAMARADAGFDEIVRAAQLAGAEEFIERLPRGYDTYLEEGPSNLSGGQRQRLAIARALMIDPPILILDEATSALDAESEAIINANLLRIARRTARSSASRTACRCWCRPTRSSCWSAARSTTSAATTNCSIAATSTSTSGTQQHRIRNEARPMPTCHRSPSPVGIVREGRRSVNVLVSAFEVRDGVGLRADDAAPASISCSMCLVAMLMLGLGLMSVIKLDKIVTGHGRIIPSEGSLYVQPLDKAIVRDISVRRRRRGEERPGAGHPRPHLRRRRSGAASGEDGERQRPGGAARGRTGGQAL